MADHAFRPRGRASQCGLSLIWVAMTCTCAFVACLSALYYWTEWKDTEAALANQKARGEQLDVLYKEKGNAIDKILPYTGFKKSGETGEPPTADAEKLLRDRQAEYNPAFLKALKIEKPLGLATVQDCSEVAGEAVEVALSDRDRAKVERDRRKSAVDVIKKRAPVIEETKQRNVEQIQKETAAVVEERTKIESEFAPEATKTEEMTKKENEEREAAEKKSKEELLRLENEVNELKRRLEEFKSREVIEHDIEGKFAFISIGSDQRVVKGLRFHCALPGQFGQFIYKGEVEVKKVWPSRAQVAVTAVYDPSRPVMKGDVLINPLFGTRQPKIMAFAGEPASRKVRFSVNEATRRILEIQSTVKPEATVDLDFLVVTEGYEGDKNYIKAVELQIPIASASDILKYLGN
jgi:hypothetical protein